MDGWIERDAVVVAFSLSETQICINQSLRVLYEE